MTDPADSALAQRLRAECARRGWDMQELARRAGISRTTLYHLLEGRTGRPRGSTLNSIAESLQIDVAELLHPQGPRSVPSAARRFDRQTNPQVDLVARERPGLFTGWDESDWDELYSTFGTGGALTREGVIAAAEGINRRRETIRRLQIVLDTHLRVVAEELVDTLYRMVRPQSNLSGSSQLRELIAGSRPSSTSLHRSPDDHPGSA